MKNTVCAVVESVGIKPCLHFVLPVTNPVTLRKHSPAGFLIRERWAIEEAIPRVLGGGVVTGRTPNKYLGIQGILLVTVTISSKDEVRKKPHHINQQVSCRHRRQREGKANTNSPL